MASLQISERTHQWKPQLYLVKVATFSDSKITAPPSSAVSLPVGRSSSRSAGYYILLRVVKPVVRSIPAIARGGHSRTSSRTPFFDGWGFCLVI
jgi:hypothetical protein